MLKDLAYLFFPICCGACDSPLYKNEKLLCTSCRHQLPLGNFHNVNAKKIEKVFYGRVKIENATSLFIFYKDSLVQNLLHNLKYRGQEEIGIELGKWLGQELQQSTKYQDIDIVIPVPLHKRRMRQRGYNQVEKFGIEIAKTLNAEYINCVLKKISYNKKQSKHKLKNRWRNTVETFGTQKESLLINKHILLVDDIVTTGATIESCVNVLKHIPGIKISIATMAITE
ncbi:ComF family protein [Aquimarina muelleri]|uniref:Amidophosphoribosyltransferase n=1 Tax=Aquimarina muelleri TaxID=279356 RepID=A0A918JTQ0_9FLAO|nr:ComF family protein [Aquimarina muelleri]MCX2761612.1 ComF family protein [Aquimarina muelleri]GGX07570.1 amidophosphoribosyltransferase [Aquimarina muelleri]